MKAEIIKRGESLPETIEKLNIYILIGKERLKADLAEIRASKTPGIAKEVQDRILKKAQDRAVLLLAAEARLGELLAAPGLSQKRTTSALGSCSLPPGVTHKASHYAQLIAANPKAIMAAIDRAKDCDTIARESDVLKLIHGAHVGHSTGENEWFTPPEYIESARKTMGGIDLDPASSALANKIVRAGKFFTAEDDGLKQKWYGRIWMNPPYSQPRIAEFAEAIVKKYRTKEIEQACALINNATETNWFQSMLSVASMVCLPMGRVKFIDRNGKPGAPLQGQAVLYFGQRTNDFAEVFCRFGAILWAKKYSEKK